MDYRQMVKRTLEKDNFRLSATMEEDRLFEKNGRIEVVVSTGSYIEIISVKKGVILDNFVDGPLATSLIKKIVELGNRSGNWVCKSEQRRLDRALQEEGENYHPEDD